MTAENYHLIGADVVHDEWRADLGDNAIVRYARDHDNVRLTPHVGGAMMALADELGVS